MKNNWLLTLPTLQTSTGTIRILQIQNKDLHEIINNRDEIVIFYQIQIKILSKQTHIF